MDALITRLSRLCRCSVPGQADGADFLRCWLIMVRCPKSGGDEDAAELGCHVGGGRRGLRLVPGGAVAAVGDAGTGSVASGIGGIPFSGGLVSTADAPLFAPAPEARPHNPTSRRVSHPPRCPTRSRAMLAALSPSPRSLVQGSTSGVIPSGVLVTWIPSALVIVCVAVVVSPSGARDGCRRAGMDGTLADAGTRFLPPGSPVVRAALARR
jgi:hypothetical protein